MKTMMLSMAAWIGACVATPPSSGPVASPAVVRVAEMSVSRAAHQATPLGSGEILITGGCSDGCDRSLRSAERYVPGARTFRPAGPMVTPRNSHAATRLADGRVLVAGGWSEREVTASAELYDPGTDRFAAVGAMTVARAAPAVAVLPDGRVLITGGQSSQFEPLASAELFDPASSQFVPAASMAAPRIGHVAVSLADGRVLILGGRQARRGGLLRSAELFDPASGQFQPAGDMATARHKHAAALLPDGRVLVIGGSDGRDRDGRYRSTELYDPATGQFTAGPDMRLPRFKLPDAVTTLASGAILVAGGAAQPELYDPGINAFVPIAGQIDASRQFATASLLRDGSVVLVGGYDDQIQTSAGAWLVLTPQGG